MHSSLIFTVTFLLCISPAAARTCYMFDYGYDSGSDSFSTSFEVTPIDSWPADHPKVEHGVCGGASAGDAIPASGQWDVTGQTIASLCDTDTSCVDECAGAGGCVPYGNCVGNGFVNPAAHFFGFNYPVPLSGNSVGLREDMGQLFLVRDSAQEVWLVSAYDQDGNADGGNLDVDITVTGSSSPELAFLGQWQNSPAGACTSSSNFCHDWDAGLKTGKLVQSWLSGGGFGLGPFASDFALSLDFQDISGLADYLHVSQRLDSGSVIFQNVSATDMLSSVRFRSANCSDDPVLSCQARSISQSIDTAPEAGRVSLDVSFVRCDAEMALDSADPAAVSGGYRLYLSRFGQERMLLADVSRASLTDGVSSVAATSLTNLEATREDHTFEVVWYDGNGESELTRSQSVADFARPDVVVTGLKHTPDVDLAEYQVKVAVKFVRPVNEFANQHFGASAYELHVENKFGERELIATKSAFHLGGTPGKETSRGFEIEGIQVPGATAPHRFVVIARNTAFASDQEASIIVDDYVGFDDLVGATVTSMAVAAVAGSVAASSSSAAAGAGTGGAAGNATASAGTLTASGSAPPPSAPVDPMVMIGNYQTINMTSKLSIDTMPTSLREFGTGMNWANGDTGLYKAMAGSEEDSSLSETKNMKLKALSSYSREVYLLSDGRPPEEFFRETCIACGIIVFCAIVFLVLQYWYYTRQHRKTDRMLQKVRDHQRIVISVLVVGYYGLSTSAMFILAVGGMPVADVIAAICIVAIVSVPLPVLSTVVYFKISSFEEQMVEADMARFREYNRSIVKRRDVYKPLVGNKQGHGWYTVLAMYRRLFMSMATALMFKLGYWQCWTVLAIYMVCFITNVTFCPFEGGYRSAPFLAETVMQILTMLTCLVPLGYYHTSGKPNEMAGMIIMFLQLGVILITLLLVVIPLFGAIFNCLLNTFFPRVVEERSIVGGSSYMQNDVEMGEYGEEQFNRGMSVESNDQPDTFYKAAVRKMSLATSSLAGNTLSRPKKQPDAVLNNLGSFKLGESKADTRAELLSFPRSSSDSPTAKDSPADLAPMPHMPMSQNRRSRSMGALPQPIDEDAEVPASQSAKLPRGTSTSDFVFERQQSIQRKRVKRAMSQSKRSLDMGPAHHSDSSGEEEGM